MLHSLISLAYIDPGTGTLVLQMLVAGVVGGIAFFRGAIFSFFGMFKGSRKESAASEADREQ
ncbi:MAG: hypothetical protein EOP84_32025 [Verrucomicrobiaceae bacterium]|nr:MAG: hypothetical protein EOP84_32025 [Verrucomicrobiaceae bacterium]